MSAREYVPGDDKLRAELGSRAGLTHVAAQAPLLPLTELDPRHFEILCYYLLCEEAGGDNFFDCVTLLSAGADKARDILLRRGAVTGIVQCKRLSRRMGPNAIATEILRYALYAVRDRSLLPEAVAQYQFWTASGLTEAARQLIDAPDSEAKLRALLPHLFAAARANHVTLRALPDETAHRAEELEALEIAARLRLGHVGPEAIARKLHRHPGIRRQFFRSPDDGPPQASNAEIDYLVQRLHATELARMRMDGRLDGQPYVARAGLDAAFAEYLEAPARLFSAIGGSGQGKTSWIAQLLKSPPSGRTMLMIPAERIAPSDRNPVDTLVRQLTAQPLEGVAPERFDQALWSWLDADNRLLVVDGLDRVISDVRETLPGWLDAALDLTLDASVRLVLTARPEAWAHLSSQVSRLGSMAFSEGGSDFGSFELGALDREEAERVYAAYGVAPEQHRGARLHSPGLIAMFAKMQASGGEIVTRYDILAREYQSLLAEVKAARVGGVSADQALNWLGDQLLAADDGWITSVPPPHVVAVLDVLVERDRLIQRESGLRVDPDDTAEFLLARRMNIDDAIQALDSGRDDPLLVGAISLLVARHEAEASADAALGKILSHTRPGMTAHLDAVARALLELRDPAAVEHRIAQAIGLWQDKNFMLVASNLGEMLVEIALPGRARFDLIRPLLHGEDADDWRGKYWRGNQVGRWISPWAMAAERATDEDPVGLLGQIIALAGERDALPKVVGEFLLFRAAQAAPEAALRESWAQRLRVAGAIQVAIAAAPLAAARFLPQLELTTPDVENFVVDRLWQIAETDLEDTGVSAELTRALAAAAGRLLAHIAAPPLRATLRVLQLRAGKDRDATDELKRLWSAIPEIVFWEAVAVLGEDGLSRIQDLLTEEPATQRRRWLLSIMPGHIFETVAPAPLLKMLKTLITRAPEHASIAADVLEIMLYRFSPGALPSLEDLAMEVARSPIDQARSKLIYYAGSPHRGEADPEELEIARRERLLDALIAHETGGTLDQLVWKIVESASERPDPLVRLVELARLDRTATLAALDRYTFLSGGETIRQQLREHLGLPKDHRRRRATRSDAS